MKNLKYAMIIFAAAAVISFHPDTVTAATYQTAAEAAAAVTGRTVEDVIQERAKTGKTYGTIADEAGKLDEFKKETFEMKKENLQQKVSDGIISQKEADRILDNMKEFQAVCDGTGLRQGTGCCYGQNNGTGFGNGAGNSKKKAQGRGNGRQKGFGQGACKSIRSGRRN